MDDSEGELIFPRYVPEDDARWRDSLGLKTLRLAWAKAEILIGLAAMAFGLRLLTGDWFAGLAGGALFTLGGYLAMAGHRSHLYLAMNRQNSHLARLIRDSRCR